MRCFFALCLSTLLRSGKTSIIKLIFEKMAAGETLQLPATEIIQIHGRVLDPHPQLPSTSTMSLVDRGHVRRTRSLANPRRTRSTGLVGNRIRQLLGRMHDDRLRARRHRT